MKLFERKSIQLLIMLMVVSTLVVGCSSDKKPATPGSEEKKTLILGLDDTFAPMGFRDEKGELVGFDIDLSKEVAKRLDVNIEYQPIDWAMKETELNAGNIDFIWNGYTITEERKEKVNFSKPYLANSQIIVTMADSTVSTLADLAGLVVSAQAESSSVDAAKAQPGFIESLKDGKLIEYATFNECFNDLESGRTDAIVVDEVLARYYMNNKGAESYKALEENLGPEEFGIGLRKEDTDLLKQLDDTLDAMRKDGTYDAIYSKWFSTN